MEGINIGDVNQQTLNAPFPMLTLANGSGNANYERPTVVPINQSTTTGNQVSHDQGQRDVSNLDPKKLKRVAASREYSQRYRQRQLQYIADLEKRVRALQAEMAIIFPRIQYADAQNALLRADNGSMREKLAALSGELMLKEAEYLELKKEKEAMKQMSLMYQAPFADISQQTNNNQYLQYNQYQYNPVIIAMDQPEFNQFAETAQAPMMQNQNLGNQFESDLNNGDNYNPM